MPRGATSRDATDFSVKALTRLAEAAPDLRWLLTRGYGMRESLQLVGNHFRLTKRQRQFLYRCVSHPDAAARRRGRLIRPEAMAGQCVLVDGYNCLIITEALLAGGAVLLTDDGVLRDVQGVFGAFRFSEHTDRALTALTEALSANTPQRVDVFLDERMRFAQVVRERWRERMAEAGMSGNVCSVGSADRALRENAAGSVLATSDRVNMDAAERVVDLPGTVAQGLSDRRNIHDIGR